MGDLEMIAELRRLARESDAANEASKHQEYTPDATRALWYAMEDEADRLLTLAETGALLSEVERRWMNLDIEMGRGILDWYIGLYEPDGDGAHVHFVRGPTLTAALRDLLGGDDEAS